jgi:PEGA domain
MISPRSYICASDPKLARQWVGPLGAVGSVVNLVQSPGEVDPQASFILTRADGPAVVQGVLDQVGADTTMMVVLPKPGLEQMLAVMHQPCVKAAVVEEYTDVRLLTYIAAKSIWGDIFGLSKLVNWGVKIHSELVSTHEERNKALASVAHFAKSFGLRKKYREAIELVLDELLMNALYNAPVDDQGRAVFGEVAPKDRAELRLERPAILQVACDGARFVLSVRDSFGSLRRETLIDYLDRASKSGGQIETKTSGAGLGLYLVANNVTEFVANILPGTATEIVAVFDLNAPRQQLKHLGVYEETFARHAENRESAGATVLARGGGTPAAAPANRLIAVTLVTAILLLLVAGVLLVYPHLTGPDLGSLLVEVDPPGAIVYLNGVRKGKATPRMELKDLETTTTYDLTARLTGYEDAREVVKVTKAEQTRLKLVLVTRKARVKISSTPSGAKIVIDGKPTPHKTPVLIEGLEPGRRHEIRLERYGFKQTSEVLTPTAEETLNLQVKLPLARGFSTVSLTSDPSQARFSVNEVDTGLKTPVTEHVLRSRLPYKLKLTLKDHVPWIEKVTPKPGEPVRHAVKLFKGGSVSVSSNILGRVSVAGVNQRLPLINRMLPVGTYRVRITSKKMHVVHTFVATVAAGSVFNRQLRFGFIKGKRRELRINLKGKRIPGAIARLPGRHPVTLIDITSGKSKDIQVDVEAGKTVLLE